MTRAAVKADRRARARARSLEMVAVWILLDLWDETAERTLFSAAAYIYETHVEPETWSIPRTLGEFLYLAEGRYLGDDDAL